MYVQTFKWNINLQSQKLLQGCGGDVLGLDFWLETVQMSSLKERLLLFFSLVCDETMYQCTYNFTNKQVEDNF